MLVDQDWDGYLIDSDDRPTTRAIVDAYADSFRNGWIGRQYRRLLLDAGFDDVRIEIQAIPLTDFAVLGPLLRDSATKAVDAGAVSPDAGNAWFADLERRAADDRFFVAMSHFVAAARVAR